MEHNLVQVNWETHKEILFSTLRSLRDAQIHTDVTLSCEGCFYPAHRLILSVCSGYFASALQIPHNSSPVFFMYGIRRPVFEAILCFIYDGMVTVSKNDIPDLLEAGVSLKIPGLTEIGKHILCSEEREGKPMDLKVSSVSSINADRSDSVSSHSQVEVTVDNGLHTDDSLLANNPLSDTPKNNDTKLLTIEGWNSQSGTKKASKVKADLGRHHRRPPHQGPTSSIHEKGAVPPKRLRAKKNHNKPKKFLCKVCSVHIEGFKAFIDHSSSHEFKDAVQSTRKKKKKNMKLKLNKALETSSKFLQNDECFSCKECKFLSFTKKGIATHRRVHIRNRKLLQHEETAEFTLTNESPPSGVIPSAVEGKSTNSSNNSSMIALTNGSVTPQECHPPPDIL